MSELLLGVGAAHAFIALAGMAVAVRAHVDGFQLADVLLAVMTAGFHAAMNGLIHGYLPPNLFLSGRSVLGWAVMRGDMHEKCEEMMKAIVPFLKCGTHEAIIKE